MQRGLEALDRFAKVFGAEARQPVILGPGSVEGGAGALEFGMMDRQ